MREEEFRTYLEGIEKIQSKTKAVNSRISKANTVEFILGRDLDSIVKDDDIMYEALKKLSNNPREKNGVLQNALRWYYRFVNDKEFPRLDSYEYYKLNR